MRIIICLSSQSRLSFPNTGGAAVFSGTLPASPHGYDPLGEKARRDIQLLSKILPYHRYICKTITLYFQTVAKNSSFDGRVNLLVKFIMALRLVK